MNIKIYEDRKLLNDSDNFGSQHENLATTLIFEFPEYVEKDGVQFATKDLNKTIIFDIEGDNELPIIDNKFSFPYEITKLGEVVWNICLKEKSETEDMTDKLIWYSETMKSTFIETNEGHNEITTEKLDSFNVVITTLNNKIAEVEKLKVEIGDFQKALNSKVDKKQGYDLSQNDFTDILKEKLENLENYDDTEIRDILNSSLKQVNYTASNGILTFTKNDGTKIEVDLPLELLVESGKYDETNKQIVLTLANGNVINIPVSDLLDDFYGKNETYNKTEVDNIIAEKQALIEKLEAENKSQQEEIDMLTADYKENTVEGESVAISDGLPKSKASSIINGNSYQYTTEGYNLLQVDEKYWKLTDKGITNLYKNAGVVLTSEGVNLKANITYYLNLVLLSKPTGATTFGNRIDNVQNDNISFMSLEKASYVIGQVFTKTYTPTKDEILDTIMWGNENNDTFEFQYWVTTDSTKTTYEKYTNEVATPNTEYEQDIEVIDGVNRFNPVESYTQNGITVTKNDNGSLTVKGTTTEQFNVNLIKETFYPKVNENYIFNVELVEGTAPASFCFWNRTDSNSELTTPVGTPKTFKFTEQKELSNFAITLPKGTTVDFTIKITLNEGTELKPYLPYGHIGLVQRGKNILDIYNGREVGYSYTEDGVTVTFLKKGGINLKGTSTRNIDFYIRGDWGNPKGTICKLKKGDNTIYLTDKTDNSVELFVIKNVNGVSSAVSSTKNIKTFNILQDIDITAVMLRVLANTTLDINLYPMIYNGTGNDVFEPYIEPIVHEIDLDGNKLAKVGEIADLLNIGVDGRVSIEKNTFLEKITSSRSIFNFEYDTNSYVITSLKKIITDENAISIISNFFKAITYLDRTNSIKDNIYVQGILEFVVRKTSFTTIEELKTFLDNNDVYIIYVLATPETINLPSIEPITMIKGITNVFELVTNLGTTLSVTYKVSNKSRLEALENAILSLGGNV